MKRKHYKAVIRTAKDELVSCVVHNSTWKITYTPGEWTKPKEGTLLFVFTTRKRAEEFRSRPEFRPHEVWRCEVKKTRKMVRIGHFVSPSTFSGWWSRFNSDLYPGISSPAPSGTRGCEAVRLIERVH